MADITLTLDGDASGAAAAFDTTADATKGLAEETAKATVKWAELANVAKQAAAAVVKFGVDAVKAYAESERVQRQLTRAAGDYADALSDQAEALSRKYAVDDDIIKQSQVLLTQWGGVGAATEDVTKAVLNYASATGQDAVGATQDLIRNVESGGAGLAKMGVHFTATGDKGKDLAAAIGAINEKFGGAADADAKSLLGSLHGASLAFDDLQKDIGESISSFLEHTGVVGRLTDAIRSLDEFITQKGAKALHDEAMANADLALAKKELANAQDELNAAMKEGVSQTIISLFSQDVDRAQAKLDALTQSTKTLVTAPKVSGQTNFGRKNAADDIVGKKTFLEDTTDADKVIDAMAAESERIQAEQEKSNQDLLDAEEQMHAQALKLQKDAEEDAEKMRLDSYKAQRAMQDKHLAETLKAEDEAAKMSAENIKRREAEWRQAGDAIGAAFVNALSDQLGKLAAGEEFDAAIFVGDILASVISVAATVIGTAYGQPALGAAVGNLASMGVRAGAAAISKGNKKKYHTGGWIGDEAELPRYHSGGYLAPDEVPMIGQKGEYMLSRRNVADMGGPAGVERAIKGGGGPTISLSVMAIDAKNAAEGFVGELGAGLKRALRTGQGDVPALLGVSPR